MYAFRKNNAQHIKFPQRANKIFTQQKSTSLVPNNSVEKLRLKFSTPNHILRRKKKKMKDTLKIVCLAHGLSFFFSSNSSRESQGENFVIFFCLLFARHLHNSTLLSGSLAFQLNGQHTSNISCWTMYVLF